MDSGDSFFGILFIVSLVCCWVMWGSEEVITPNAYEHAVSLCVANEGLKEIELDGLDYDVTCNNKAYFEFGFNHDDEYGE